jgi:hypothetical protein
MTGNIVKFPKMKCQAAKACLTAAVIWLASFGGACAVPADVTLHLTPAEVVAIVRSMDQSPISQVPPAGFWDAQVKIKQALEANPEAWREVKSALEHR